MPPPMTYFRNYPEPFYADWKGEPHPGWGMRPVMAGPARVGVGALKFTAQQTAAITAGLREECRTYYAASAARQQQLNQICPELGEAIAFQPPSGASEDESGSSATSSGMPWWAWVGGAAVLLGVVGYATAKIGR